MRREWFLALASIALSVSAFLVIVELVLRFLPVATGFHAMPVTSSDPVFHFAPNRPFVFSKGWNMDLVNEGRSNNDGWINDQAYEVNSNIPLLAIVGDSMIEAAMVPYRRTVQGRLANEFQGRIRVYSFAGSGAPLSQYLIWARYAVQKYRASALVINIVKGDFEDSLYAYNPAATGFWQYAPGADGQLHLALTEFKPSPARHLVRSSALGRYLAINVLRGVSIQALGASFRKMFLGEVGKSKNMVEMSSGAQDRQVTDSLLAIDAFFRDLPEMVNLPPNRTAFTIDGFRYPEPASQGTTSYFGLMRSAFSKKALSLGYEVIDLDQFFLARYRNTGERFEFPNDHHWNATGHGVVAEAIRSSRLFSAFLRQH